MRIVRALFVRDIGLRRLSHCVLMYAAMMQLSLHYRVLSSKDALSCRRRRASIYRLFFNAGEKEKLNIKETTYNKCTSLVEATFIDTNFNRKINNYREKEK